MFLPLYIVDQPCQDHHPVASTLMTWPMLWFNQSFNKGWGKYIQFIIFTFQIRNENHLFVIADYWRLATGL